MVQPSILFYYFKLFSKIYFLNPIQFSYYCLLNIQKLDKLLRKIKLKQRIKNSYLLSGTNSIWVLDPPKSRILKIYAINLKLLRLKPLEIWLKLRIKYEKTLNHACEEHGYNKYSHRFFKLKIRAKFMTLNDYLIKLQKFMLK